MSGAPVLEIDGVRITALDRPIHEALPGAEVAAWRGGRGEESPDEQRAEEEGRERDIAAQGWGGQLAVAAVRAKLQSLFGAPVSRGDDYKLSFEYPLRAETSAGPVLLSVGDWKTWSIVIFQEYSTSSPEARRVARRAVWRAVVGAPLADFEDRFGYDEAEGAAYGCRGGQPWVDDEAVNASVMEAWEAEEMARAAAAEAEGPRRGVRRLAWVVWAASVAVGFVVGARWSWEYGLLAWLLIWAVANPLLRARYRRR